MTLIEIGRSVKVRRRKLGLARRALAERAGVSVARLEALENARASEMGFKTLTKVLNSVGLDLRLTELNRRRPTLEDLRAEEHER
jgi:transcriptional regulator with XRE-family HTH domain